jgi:sulfide:quinone oxidoreductase
MSMNVVIAGGGVAGLEALLGLDAIAGDSVALTLIAPDPDFSYRPMAVAEPFALGRAHRVPLSRFAHEAGAELVQAAVVAADDAAGELRLDDGGKRAFDALIVAPGARAVSGVEGATTWWPGGDPEIYGGLLRDGYSKRLAMVVPPGSVWPLPVYELALMTAGEASAMGHDDVVVTVVTPEHEPLSLFGHAASAAVADELRSAGIELKIGVVPRAERGGLVLAPGSDQLSVQRVFAVRDCSGPPSTACRPTTKASSWPTTQRGAARAAASAKRRRHDPAPPARHARRGGPLPVRAHTPVPKRGPAITALGRRMHESSEH